MTGEPTVQPSAQPTVQPSAEPTVQPSGGVQTIEEERVQTYDGGDHERLSHFVEKDRLTEAMVMGTPVVALCGKVWVPSRDPERFPVCPECQEIWESLRDDDDQA